MCCFGVSDLHFVGEFDIRISVAEAGDVRHLSVTELEERIPVIILHLHDVEHLGEKKGE